MSQQAPQSCYRVDQTETAELPPNKVICPPKIEPVLTQEPKIVVCPGYVPKPHFEVNIFKKYFNIYIYI